MNNLQANRREFIKRSLIAASAFPFLNACNRNVLAVNESSKVLAQIRKNAQPKGSEGMGAIDVPDSVSWRSAFAVTPDDGEPMVISGTIFQQDGKTAAPNVLVYFYHTDKFGIYGREGQPKHGRFRGWILTDEKGRYEFSSIRPASYPNSTISQHVHMTLTGTDFREDWIDSILFEGDRFLTERERTTAGKRGGFNPIVTLIKGSDGVLRATRDIQLMKA